MSARPNDRRCSIRARNARGYTLVEVMMALAVLGVGVTGILAMENAAILANRRGHEMTTATNIARRWMERLRGDSYVWNAPSQTTAISDLGRDTRYLCMLVGCATGGGSAANQWATPRSFGATGSGDLESAAFDMNGSDVPIGSPLTRFCTSIRLNWLMPQTATRQGLIRAEIRVWWFREGTTRNPAYANCTAPPAAGALASDNTVSAVYMAASITGMPL